MVFCGEETGYCTLTDLRIGKVIIDFNNNLIECYKKQFEGQKYILKKGIERYEKHKGNVLSSDFD